MFSRYEKTCLFGTEPNKYHMILIVFFIEDENDDAKIIILTYQE